MASQHRLFEDRPKRGDICLRRARGNNNSRKAGLRVAVAKESTAERLRVFVSNCAHNGATLLELAAVTWDERKQRFKFPNEISGRLTELKAERKLFASGRDRDGSEVLVADEKWCNGSAK